MTTSFLFSNPSITVLLVIAGFGFLINGAFVVTDMFHVGISISISIGSFVTALYYVMKEYEKDWKVESNRM